jgi:diazepam-binding inhibitor (GABA receptor modulating acyl-CoA-binding protein)
MSNSKEFTTAVETVVKLVTQPTTDEMLKLYGYYKQAVVGDINISKPGFFSFKESKKWEAWNDNKGMNKFDSEVKYILLVNELIQKYGLKN